MQIYTIIIMKYSYVLLIIFSSITRYSIADVATEFSKKNHFYQLDNGLNVVLIPHNISPIIYKNMIYHVGLKDEPQGKSGLSHLLEHLLFRGSEVYIHGTIKNFVSDMGGYINASTRYDSTIYTEHILKDELETLLMYDSIRMRYLNLTEESFQKELKVVLEERYSLFNANPDQHLTQSTRTALYQNHPYRIPLIGWEHELQKLTKQDALDFFQTYYHPNNATLLIVGDVDIDYTKTIIQNLYGDIAQKTIPRVSLQEPPSYGTKKIYYHHKNIDAEYVTIQKIVPSLRSHNNRKQAIGLNIIEDIWAGKTGLLEHHFVRIQDDVFDASVYYNDSFDYQTLFAYHVVANYGKPLQEVEKKFVEFIQTKLQKKLTDEQVQASKNRILTQLLLYHDDLRAMTNFWVKYLQIGLSYDEIIQMIHDIEHITTDDVNKALDLINITDDGWVYSYLHKK